MVAKSVSNYFIVGSQNTIKILIIIGTDADIIQFYIKLIDNLLLLEMETNELNFAELVRFYIIIQ